MAKLPSYRRIYRTDYESQYQKLIEKLSVSINNGFDVLYDALNKKLSLRDNGLDTIKDVPVKVDANGIPTQSSTFLLDNPNITTVIGLQVILATNNDNSKVYPTGQPFVNFSQSGKSVLINQISGLQANTNYTLRIVAYGE